MGNTHITASDILMMEQLRAQGYSNMQIAHDMGHSKTTVWKHIGPQGKGIRAEYGSYKTHCVGEPYCKGAAISNMKIDFEFNGDSSSNIDLKLDLPKMDLKPEDWNGPITANTIVGDIPPSPELVTVSSDWANAHAVNFKPQDRINLTGYTIDYKGKEFKYTIDNWPDGRDVVITKIGSGASITVRNEDLNDFIAELMELSQKIPELAE